MLVVNEESSQPLKIVSRVIRYTLIHPNVIQRLNICGFNCKSSLTLNTANVIEGGKISVEILNRLSSKTKRRRCVYSKPINIDVAYIIPLTLELNLSTSKRKHMQACWLNSTLLQDRQQILVF